MPFCPKCGKEVPEGAIFCPSCGARIAPLEKKPGRRKVVGALIGLGALTALGFLAYRYYGSELQAFLERLTGKLRSETIKTVKPSPSGSSTSTSLVTSKPPPTTTPSTTVTSTTVFTSTATATSSETTTSSSTTTTKTTETTVTVTGLPERDWGTTLTPYLFAGGQAYYDEIETVVVNEGDAPAYYTVLELYGGPYPKINGKKWIDHALNSFRLMWYKILPLHPGQRMEFKFTANESWPKMLIWVAYDPILDSKGFRMDSAEPVRTVFRNSKDRDRHLISFGRYGEVGEW